MKTKHILTAVVAVAQSLVPMVGAAQQGPLMGWSSWNAFRVHINDSIIRTQVDAMERLGLRQKGYTFINIDDGYFGGRNANGNLIIHPTKFPSGLKPLVDYIHAHGMKAGIYSDAGRNTCGNYWDDDEKGQGVGLYGHDAQDADFFFRRMGFDFIKLDFCGGDPKQNTERLSLNPEERYRAIHRAIQATGRDVKLNVCRWDYPGTWVKEVATSWRISHDISPHWWSVRDIIQQNLYLSAYCSNGHFNDMDMLEVGRGMTADEDVTHFATWCIMSSPLLIGCDLNKVSESALALLKNEELLALNQDTLYLQAYVAQRQGHCYTLVKDLHKRYDKERAVAVVNLEDEKKWVSVPMSTIELGGKVKVRDVVQREDLGTVTDTLRVEVPAHGTRVFTLKAQRRLERSLYEAETAYIDAYQETENNVAKRTGIYEQDGTCSGGVKASWLGCSDRNSLLFPEVYSQRGGKYTLTIHAKATAQRQVVVEVNGKPCTTLTFAAQSRHAAPESMECEVNLQRGNNTIRLVNAHDWMPDVDCIRLTVRE